MILHEHNMINSSVSVLLFSDCTRIVHIMSKIAEFKKRLAEGKAKLPDKREEPIPETNEGDWDEDDY